MSIASSRRRSHLSTIKGSELTPNRYNTPSQTARKVLRFQLPHSDRVKTILQQYVSGENIKEYERLLCAIRDDELGDSEIRSLLQEASQCISLLNQDLRLFVEAILGLKWTNKPDDFVKEYRSFLINLLSAHNYHVQYTLDQLVLNFIPGITEEEWNNGVPSDEECKKFANVHSVINILLKIIPMSRELLRNSFVNLYPYFKRPSHCHEVYLHNILWVLDYQPELQQDLFYLIFSRLIVLDTNAPKERIFEMQQLDDEIFTMDDCKSVKSEGSKKHLVAHTLDICLDRLFNFVIVECHDMTTGQLEWDKTKQLYHVFLDVFDKLVLPTYNVHHVQFVIFFVCSLRGALADAFITHLCKKVYSPSIAPVLRQTAVAYLSSLMARASYLPLSLVREGTQRMASWIHSYITSQDGLDCLNSDARVHAVFYSVCQALFYVIAFRHRELVSTKKGITFLANLNLGKIVTCRLNPLRVCQPAVVQNFAAVTRKYQLAYCYSIMEHNARNTMPTIYTDEKGCVSTRACVLDSFFPFDPYVLPRSGLKLTTLYLEYQAASTTSPSDQDFIAMDVEPRDEDDDFLNDSICSNLKNNMDRFSYGTSPGFKH